MVVTWFNNEWENRHIIINGIELQGIVITEPGKAYIIAKIDIPSSGFYFVYVSGWIIGGGLNHTIYCGGNGWHSQEFNNIYRTQQVFGIRYFDSPTTENISAIIDDTIPTGGYTVDHNFYSGAFKIL